MRGVTGFRLVDTMLGALAQIVPGRVPAAGEGGISLVYIGGYREAGEAFVMADLVVGNWGGRPTKDGVDGITNPVAIVSNVPAELMELEYPVRLEQYALVCDTGGAGKYRGGLAICREWRFVGEEATVSTRSDRRKHRPYGLHGGLTGGPSSMEVITNGKVTARGTKDTFQIKRGDLIRHITAGGGGWGDPLERDPQMVLQDVWYEKVSIERARELYGVVIDRQTLRIDEQATNELRRSRVSA
jgi:N-methylhydantoinase B